MGVKLVTTRKSIRLDGLPEDVQKKILALRDQALGGGSVIFTRQQVERVIHVLDNGLPGHDAGWAATNSTTAMGRVVLRYFAENTQAKKQFKAYLTRLQTQGRVVERRPPQKASASA